MPFSPFERNGHSLTRIGHASIRIGHMRNGNRPGDDGAAGAEGLLHSLAKLGGSASPAELYSACGISSRTGSRRLAELVAAGLVAGSKQCRELTPAGWSVVTGPLAVSEGSYDLAAGHLFAPALAGFARLGADAVAARYLFPEHSWHPALGVCGPPGRGKSAWARFVLWGFGLAPGVHLVEPARMSVGELRGRRRQTKEGFEFEPSPLADLSAVVLDEWADAEQATRQAALAYCAGDTTSRIEGQLVHMRPTALLTWNPTAGADPCAPLPDAARRRVLILNAGAIGPDPSLARRLAEFYREEPPSPYKLEALRRGPDRLPDAVWAIWEDPDAGVNQVLSQQGLLRYGDRRSLELLTLGRAARLGLAQDDDLQALFVGVLVDLFAAAETVPGQIVYPAWRAHMATLQRWTAGLGAPGSSAVGEVIQAYQEDLGRHRAELRARKLEGESGDLKLMGLRAAVVERFDLAEKAIRRLPAFAENRRPEAAGLRSQLRELATRARNSRSPERLDDVTRLGEGPLAAATRLRSEVDAEVHRRRWDMRQARATAQQEQRREVQRQRAFARAHQVARVGRKAEVAPLRTPLVRLTRRRSTKPGENVATELVRLKVLKPEEITETIQPTPWEQRQAAKRGGPPPSVRTRLTRTGRYIDSHGIVYQPSQLRAWDAPSVQGILAGAIARLDAYVANGPQVAPMLGIGADRAIDVPVAGLQGLLAGLPR